MNKLLFGFLTLSVIGLTSVPASAGDTGVVQDNNQTSVITGNGNDTYQTNKQTSRTNNRNNGRGDSATVQNNNQTCDIVGNRNYCEQQNSQNSEQSRNNRRR
jgi:hypothetical protein